MTVHRLLIGSKSGITNNTATGLIDLTLSATGAEDDSITVLLVYLATTDAGATRSIETGMASFTFSQDMSGRRVAATPAKFGNTQSLDARVASLMVSVTATTASNVATLKITVNQNPADTATVAFR